MTADTILPRTDAAAGERTGIGGAALLVMLALVAAGFDALLLAFALDLLPGHFAALHLMLAGLVGLAASYGTTNRMPALLLALSTASMGPFGAIGAAVLILRLARSRGRTGELSRWHRQLSGMVDASDAQSLYEDIVEGRAYQPGRIPPCLDAVMAAGSVRDRQAVLGLLVKQSQPVPPGLVERALRSRDVAVRASAAAVVARLRERPIPASRELSGVEHR